MSKHIASISFGKDSLAMLLLLIEKEYPLNEVVFYDTGMEFQAIYNLRDKIKPLLSDKGIKYTELQPKNSFSWDMYERVVNKKDGSVQYGYHWCGGKTRWGTTKKLEAIDKYCIGAIQSVGIANDEFRRIPNPLPDNKFYPLFNWGITELQALEYCRDKGYYWKEGIIDLYEILDRVSCWCCGNKNLKELRNMYNYLPEYWDRLKFLQTMIPRPFYGNKTIFDLEERFKREAEQMIMFEEAI